MTMILMMTIDNDDGTAPGVQEAELRPPDDEEARPSHLHQVRLLPQQEAAPGLQPPAQQH